MEVIAWIALGLGFASALPILADELLLGNRQHMWVMNLVHPITALYWGPAWLWAYVRHGRKAGTLVLHRDAERLAATGELPQTSDEGAPVACCERRVALRRGLHARRHRR